MITLAPNEVAETRRWLGLLALHAGNEPPCDELVAIANKYQGWSGDNHVSRVIAFLANQVGVRAWGAKARPQWRIALQIFNSWYPVQDLQDVFSAS